MSNVPSLLDVQKRRGAIRQQIEDLQAEDAGLAHAEEVLKRLASDGTASWPPANLPSKRTPQTYDKSLKNQEDKVFDIIVDGSEDGITTEDISQEILERHRASIKTTSLHAVLSKLRSANKIKKENGLWYPVDLGR